MTDLWRVILAAPSNFTELTFKSEGRAKKCFETYSRILRVRKKIDSGVGAITFVDDYGIAITATPISHPEIHMFAVGAMARRAAEINQAVRAADERFEPKSPVGINGSAGDGVNVTGTM